VKPLPAAVERMWLMRVEKPEEVLVLSSPPMPLPEGTPEYRTMDELYDLYVAFGEDFLEACVAGASLPWLKQHYQNSMRPKSFPDFCGWWSTLPATAQRYHRTLWEGGYEQWMEKARKKDREIARRIQKEGFPPEVRVFIDRCMRQLGERE